MAQPPVLNLTTEDVRPIVRFNGREYELRTSRDLTLEQFKAIERISPRLGALLERSTPLSADESTEASELLAAATAIAMVAPAAVLARLGDVQRAQVTTFFFARLTPSLRMLSATVMEEATRVPGTRRSSGSSGSIPGARSKTGFGGRRSASSGRV